MTTPVTLINVFEIPLGTEQEFIEWWKRSSEALTKEPGFIDARLHRSLRTDARFQLINIAHWETAEALHNARRKHHDILNALGGGKGHPAFYEVVAQY